MKIGQIELEEFDHEVCKHCELHRHVANWYGGVECAWCGHWNPAEITDLKPVGETNADEPDEEITHTYVLECLQCHKHTGYMPTKIIWNANHDTYYTGGRKYLPEVSGMLELDKSIEDKIENYTQRILAGEDDLRPWNLRVWIQYAIEAAVADLLYKTGFKR